MTPELRKEASELRLHKRGIRINVQLHVIESDDEVVLRSVDALIDRLLALWLVADAAQARVLTPARAMAEAHDLQRLLSREEAAFLSDNTPDEATWHHFASASEALYFLAWCGGLLSDIQVSAKPSNMKALARYFPAALQDRSVLHRAVRLRPKAQILDWCDFLYRLHWAVRHAQLTNKACPPNVHSAQVREWHRAVNWLCAYEEEDDWDRVSTET